MEQQQEWSEVQTEKPEKEKIEFEIGENKGKENAINVKKSEKETD